MTTPMIDLKRIHAVVYITYYEYDIDLDSGYETWYSIPVKVIEYEAKKVTVEEFTEQNPRRFTFYLIERPNGVKSWEVLGEEAAGEGDISLSLVFGDDCND